MTCPRCLCVALTLWRDVRHQDKLVRLLLAAMSCVALSAVALTLELPRPRQPWLLGEPTVFRPSPTLRELLGAKATCVSGDGREADAAFWWEYPFVVAINAPAFAPAARNGSEAAATLSIALLADVVADGYAVYSVDAANRPALLLYRGTSRIAHTQICTVPPPHPSSGYAVLAQLSDHTTRVFHVLWVSHESLLSGPRGDVALTMKVERGPVYHKGVSIDEEAPVLLSPGS